MVEPVRMVRPMARTIQQIADDPTSSPAELLAALDEVHRPRTPNTALLGCLLRNPQMPPERLARYLASGNIDAWANLALPLHLLAGDIDRSKAVDGGALLCAGRLFSDPRPELRDALAATWAPLYDDVRRGDDGPLFWMLTIERVHAASGDEFARLHRERTQRALELFHDAIPEELLQRFQSEHASISSAMDVLAAWAASSPQQGGRSIEAALQGTYNEIEDEYLAISDEDEPLSSILASLREILLYAQNHEASTGISVGTYLISVAMYARGKADDVPDPYIAGKRWLADRVRHELPSAAELLR